MTDRRAAEILYPNQGGDWKIEFRQKPIAHRGHAFLALIHKGEVVRELHGFGHSRHTDERQMLATDGAHLRGTESHPDTLRDTKSIGVVKAGSKEEIGKLWAKGASAASAITEGNFDYKAHDPSYELGTDGGQIQNSNSVAYTVAKAMGLAAEADRLLHEQKESRRFSGWNRDLLDPKYKRYAAPPVFPVRDAP